ncbi:MAG: ATP-binding protein [Pseudomonadota bacterium]
MSTPGAAPTPPGATGVAAAPEVLSGRRTAWLYGLLAVGFTLIIGLQAWFSSLIEEIDAQRANERVRLFVGEEIARGIQALERDIYRLGTTGGTKGQQLVAAKIATHVDKLRQDILVLDRGGTVRQTIDLNLQGRDQMLREVRYLPARDAGGHVMELIELLPWLDEITGKLTTLRALLARRDAHRQAGDAEAALADEDEISLFLKGIPPMFLRLGENANRLLYESQNRQAVLETRLARQQRQLEYTKHALVLLVAIGIAVPGMLALRQINAANRKLREAWMEMRHARDEAERASRTKSEFLSRMSHELRTPLNAILGFGQLLALESRDKDQAENVAEILRAGEHLLELINEVLDLARIEAGRLDLKLEAVALTPLIEESLTLIRPLAEARGIRVTVAGRGCAGHVLADRVRLKQVLINLLSNAVKYNHEGGDIGIACEVAEDAVQIRVSDTGAGLTAEQQARLFTAFERLDADRAAIEGTGIGLALCKRLAELMQGEIGVESTPGAGSTFWLSLRASAPPAQGPIQ